MRHSNGIACSSAFILTASLSACTPSQTAAPPTTSEPSFSETTDQECSPANGAEFICGVHNVEDFVRLPEGRLIGSDLVDAGAQGKLFAFKPDRSVSTIAPRDFEVKPNSESDGCPGHPDWDLFSPHGMDIKINGANATLYAVNHGGREAVEFFDVDLSSDVPRLTWTGCVVPPKDAWPDDVAVLPNGGLLVTSLWDPRDQNAEQSAIAGERNGELLEWHSDDGWSTVAGTEDLSGPNGVIVSPDGSTVYMAAWSGKQLVTINRDAATVETTDLDFTPDNLTWAADGKTFFIGGTTANVADALECQSSEKVNCPSTGVRIDRFNPADSTRSTLVNGNDFGEFGMATGAIDMGDELWVNSYGSDRIAVFDLAK